MRLSDAPGITLRIRCAEVVLIYWREHRLCEVSARACCGVACVFHSDGVTEVIDYADTLFTAVINERGRISPRELRQLVLCFIDRPCAAVYLRNLEVACVSRHEHCARRVLARLDACVSAVLDFDSFRNIDKIYAVLIPVIFERLGVIPAYIRDVYFSPEDPPGAVRRGCNFKIVPVIFEIRVRVVYACIVCGSIFVFRVYALRQPFEFYLLDLSVICERPAVIPSDAGHVKALLAYPPSDGHILRCMVIMCIRIDENCAGGILAGSSSLTPAVSYCEFLRVRCQLYSVYVSVVFEVRLFAPRCAGHII